MKLLLPSFSSGTIDGGTRAQRQQTTESQITEQSTAVHHPPNCNEFSANQLIQQA